MSIHTCYMSCCSVVCSTRVRFFLLNSAWVTLQSPQFLVHDSPLIQLRCGSSSSELSSVHFFSVCVDCLPRRACRISRQTCPPCCLQIPSTSSRLIYNYSCVLFYCVLFRYLLFLLATGCAIRSLLLPFTKSRCMWRRGAFMMLSFLLIMIYNLIFR